jgi:hypothetical protein
VEIVRFNYSIKAEYNSNLRRGSTVEGLRLLTGAPCHQIDLNPFEKTIDFHLIWNQLLSARQLKYSKNVFKCQNKMIYLFRLLIGVSTCRNDLNIDEYHRTGIEPNHAFSLLFATTVSTSPYIVLY